MLRDFSMEPSGTILNAFMQSQNLFNLIISNTCFKENDPCIDLILTTKYFALKTHLNLRYNSKR